MPRTHLQVVKHAENPTVSDRFLSGTTAWGTFSLSAPDRIPSAQPFTEVCSVLVTENKLWKWTFLERMKPGGVYTNKSQTLVWNFPPFLWHIFLALKTCFSWCKSQHKVSLKCNFKGSSFPPWSGRLHLLVTELLVLSFPILSGIFLFTRQSRLFATQKQVQNVIHLKKHSTFWLGKCRTHSLPAINAFPFTLVKILSMKNLHKINFYDLNNILHGLGELVILTYFFYTSKTLKSNCFFLNVSTLLTWIWCKLSSKKTALNFHCSFWATFSSSTFIHSKNIYGTSVYVS